MNFTVYLWSSFEEGEKCFARLSVACESEDDLHATAERAADALGAHAHGYDDKYTPGFVDRVNGQ